MRRLFLSLIVSLATVAGALPFSPAYAQYTPVDSVTVLHPTQRELSPAEWDAFYLARGVDRLIAGELREAAELLEKVDTSRGSTFARADRAAFLLAAIYIELEDAAGFDALALRAGDGDGTPYQRWIRYTQLMQGRPGSEGTAITSAPGTELLNAALLIEAGRPDDALELLDRTESPSALMSLHLFMRAQTRASIGGDAKPDWARLSERKPKNPLEGDLVAAALLELAATRLANGGDAVSLLERIPEDSRHAARALHVRAMIAAEQGDTSGAMGMMRKILDDYPMYEQRRELQLALGGVAMDGFRWQQALELFDAADDDWLYEHDLLANLENDEVLDDIWRAWEHQKLWRDEIRLSPEGMLTAVNDAAREALDLRRDPNVKLPSDLTEGLWPAADDDGQHATWDRTDALARHYPAPGEWSALRDIERQLGEARTALARQDRVVVQRQLELTRRVDYLQRGHDDASESTVKLNAAVLRLEDILAQLNDAVRQLEAVRDSALLDIATRTRDMTSLLRQEILFMQAVRHFHVEGPNLDRPERFPDGVPSPAQVLVMEESLAIEATALLDLLAEHYPNLIARSFDEVWEPRLTGDSKRLYEGLLAQLIRSRTITSALDSTLAYLATDPELAAAITLRDDLAAKVETLAQQEQDKRREIALAVAERGRERMAGEREAIDYHLADASYELAVEVATNPATAEIDSVVTPARTRAIGHLGAFLTRYPNSIARGESRFRMADMQLMQAKDEFQIKMAEFLGEDPSADDIEDRSLAPFVNYAPAIELYRAILAEDQDFPHQDAVLFNLGMILSDDGQPGATELLERLVTTYPNSPNVQEAYLRLGNDYFDRQNYAGCIKYFEHAADGADPSFTAIALYKLGWARFEADDFDRSADAFRRLLDLYTDHADVARAMDLRDEAEEYLVHSLARSGGATAFSAYFDRIGGRPYESDILISLGHLLRGVSMYEEAIECDELWIARYPDEERTLAVAERLVSTYKRWNKPDTARQAKLANAQRFLPGSSWYAANTDPGLRAKGEKFAQTAYLETAAHYHKLAREKDEASDWQFALSNYETYLDRWPTADDADRIHFLAGEAANHVNGYAAALTHFEQAARSDSTQLVIDATWQKVAVTDAWYRSSRPHAKANGVDSLATKLLNAAEDFVLLFPTDERGADIIWRKANIAYAHEWYDAAAYSFAQMTERYPEDPRASLAVRMRGDAHYKRGEYEDAGAAYEQTLTFAQAAGQDSIVATMRKAVPLSYYKHAEAVAAADTVSGEANAAPYFNRVAQQWPYFEHADLALYRAGLGFAAAKSYSDAAAAWEQLLAKHPDSEYAKDSAIQIARAHETSGNVQSAARAYERFSRLYSDDPDAPEALLRAADMLAEAKDEAGAEQMRSTFLKRFPGDTETVMEIRADRAVKDLAKVTAGGATLGSLLGAATGAKAGASTSELQAYLALAAQHPELATPQILAQVDYLKAEESFPKYTAMRLTQPLPKSIEAKKKSMESVIKLYNTTTQHGVAEYSHASAHRIGQILIAFGDALVESERPKDLNEDDMLAYDEVLEEQAWDFYDRGEEVWTEMLRMTVEAENDPGGWIARTQQTLWPRLAMRFLYQPEVDYPLVRATPAQRLETN